MVRPLLLSLILALGACSEQRVIPTDEPQPTLTAPVPTPSSSVAAWREPREYSFTLNSQCGERGGLGLFHVKVQNGRVLEVVGLDDAGRRHVASAPDGRIVGLVPTLADLLAQATDARNDGADEVTVTTDPADGHPTSVTIDWVTEAIDDEACYTITDFVHPG